VGTSTVELMATGDLYPGNAYSYDMFYDLKMDAGITPNLGGGATIKHQLIVGNNATLSGGNGYFFTSPTNGVTTCSFGTGITITSTFTWDSRAIGAIDLYVPAGAYAYMIFLGSNGGNATYRLSGNVTCSWLQTGYTGVIDTFSSATSYNITCSGGLSFGTSNTNGTLKCNGSTIIAPTVKAEYTFYNGGIVLDADTAHFYVSTLWRTYNYTFYHDLSTVEFTGATSVDNTGHHFNSVVVDATGNTVSVTAGGMPYVDGTLLVHAGTMVLPDSTSITNVTVNGQWRKTVRGPNQSIILTLQVDTNGTFVSGDFLGAGGGPATLEYLY
jgi:hypothetical protein